MIKLNASAAHRPSSITSEVHNRSEDFCLAFIIMASRSIRIGLLPGDGIGREVIPVSAF